MAHLCLHVLCPLAPPSSRQNSLFLGHPSNLKKRERWGSPLSTNQHHHHNQHQHTSLPSVTRPSLSIFSHAYIGRCLHPRRQPAAATAPAFCPSTEPPRKTLCTPTKAFSSASSPNQPAPLPAALLLLVLALLPLLRKAVMTSGTRAATV